MSASDIDGSRSHQGGAYPRWLNRQLKDPYTKEAKVQNLRSRAAFKLMQIDDKYRLFSKNRTDQRILDLGYAPGAWSQVARQRSSPNSMILGVDILPCEPPHGVNSIQANILAKRTHDLIRSFF
ncbi:AVN_HP_G0049610.mRNA.1.CDS.1 [Saccharomyces cerevisiae]|nr:AVN_HP_G0049610.mRNA.1.CDS.1 [Saccharomyces cerevisiae]CAI6923521.1 AVN_HP_G0049610.mRNA.1.CDS.1 [Saccharomyces cerevisiae]